MSSGKAQIVTGSMMPGQFVRENYLNQENYLNRMAKPPAHHNMHRHRNIMKISALEGLGLQHTIQLDLTPARVGNQDSNQDQDRE
jgi:hypothetical protein